MYKYTLPNGITIDSNHLVDAVLSESEYPQTYLDTETGILLDIPSLESLRLWVDEIGKVERYIIIERFSNNERRIMANEFIEMFLKHELSSTERDALDKTLLQDGWYDFETYLLEKTDGWIHGWEQYKHDSAWEYVHDWLINNPVVHITTSLDMSDDCDCAICALMKNWLDNDPQALKKAFETEAVMQSVQAQILDQKRLVKNHVALQHSKVAGQIFVFKITLNGSSPRIWRRIAVPATYSFFELHCAIQDAMGWSGYHLHSFRITQNKKGVRARDAVTTISIPNPEYTFQNEFVDDKDGRTELIAEWFGSRITQCVYTYDFGDNWDHTVQFEKAVPRDPGVTYPLCLSGKNACPQEDCGGVWGYDELKEIITKPRHKEHKSMLEWLGLEHATEFDPVHFDPKEVVFTDPKEYLDIFEK